MKIGNLIEQLSKLDPESYIHLFAKDTKFPFTIKREYPESDYNYNMIIQIPDDVIYKDISGLTGHTEEDWVSSPMSKTTTASTTDEEIVIDMSNEELPKTVLQPFVQIINEEEGE